MGKMNTTRRWRWWWLAGPCLALAAAGCQTWTSGMTLPSGRYLEHPPQYFQQSPAFPLGNELAAMEAAAPLGGAAALGPLPAAVPGGAVGPVAPFGPQGGPPRIP
jgi:hypothetical protein